MYNGVMSEPHDKPKRKRGRPRSADSKRSRGVDRHAGVRTVVYLPHPLAARLDAYVAGVAPATTKAAVLRLALETYLDRAARKGGAT